MVGIKKAWGIALIGAAGPFLTGYVAILLYYDDQNMVIMSGLTLTATAVSLSMMTLKSYGMSKSARHWNVAAPTSRITAPTCIHSFIHSMHEWAY